MVLVIIFPLYTAPIVQNIVAIINGAEKWERTFAIDFYILFSIEPWFYYVVFYLWTGFYMVYSLILLFSSEIHFYTMSLLVSIEFENLADEFGRFDYKYQDKEDFKKLIDQHNELLDIVDELNSLYRVPIFIKFLDSTVLICFSMLQFFSPDVLIVSTKIADIMNIIKFALYLNGSIMQIFLLCFYGQKITSANEKISENLMNGNWYEAADRKMVKDLHLVLLRSQRPVELQAYVFFGINMETFTYVISTAHSYFSCLNSIR
ncbi:hypothetical protein PVAND_013331 [Polypedilum vanderplanki]|uniref:Odorant receptor n=1 Tax=Polypedilum vanderplanki TaxID=319348 RepID=A0A9J6CP61_POLVA|nr:hypothetical protein PVAND_013331 [Polypedilum vanderplanki]